MLLGILFEVPRITHVLELRYKGRNERLVLHRGPGHFEVDMSLDIVAFAQPFVKLWMTQLRDEKLGRRVEVHGEGDLRLENAQEDLVVRFAVVATEGGFAREEFVDEDAEGPPVHHLHRREWKHTW